MKARMQNGKIWNQGRLLSEEEMKEISEGTIERFTQYIEQQLKYGDEKMENETQKEMNAWDNIGGDYVKIESGKAKVLLVQNWKVQQIKKFKDDNGNLKEQIEFSCDVISEDGMSVNKKYNTTSYSALRGLKEIFNNRQSTAPVLIRVKKIGEGKSTVYDVEEIKTR